MEGVGTRVQVLRRLFFARELASYIILPSQGLPFFFNFVRDYGV